MEQAQQPLREREAQLRRLHHRIQKYQLSEEEQALLQQNQQDIKYQVESKYRASPINCLYNFPKLSVASSQYSEAQSLRGSNYNLFEQNHDGPSCDWVLYPPQQQEKAFLKRQKQPVQKKDSRPKRLQAEGKGNRVEPMGGTPSSRKNQTQVFEMNKYRNNEQGRAPSRMQIQCNESYSKHNNQYLVEILRKFKQKENVRRPELLNRTLNTKELKASRPRHDKKLARQERILTEIATYTTGRTRGKDKTRQKEFSAGRTKSSRETKEKALHLKQLTEIISVMRSGRREDEGRAKPKLATLDTAGLSTILKKQKKCRH